MTTTNDETRINPLANDGFSSAATLTAVSDPAIVIQGRTLIIPAGYVGPFTYTATDGTITGQGLVTVTGGTAITAPTTFNGVLLNSANIVVGWSNVTISAKGIATALVRAGAESLSAKVTLPAPPGLGNGSEFTKFGNLTLVRNANNTLSFILEALGGNLTGTLRAARTTSAVEKHNMALASIEAAVKFVGVLPDGGAFLAATSVSDNGSIAFFAEQTKAKPTEGGRIELTVP